MVEPVETSAFAASLGVALIDCSESSARLELPYRDANANPGQALHGGCAASLGLIGGRLVAEGALGSQSGPFVTVACHVSYLSAAVAEDVVAETRLARRDKQLCFSTTAVTTGQGKPVAEITSVVRALAGEPTTEAAAALGDEGGSEPGPMGPLVTSMPFIAARRIAVEHMAGGGSRLVMPIVDANTDADGSFHEGAVAALLDTTGAMAAWGLTGPGRLKASTAALQLQLLGRLRAGELVAYGRVGHRDRDLFWCDVEVAEAATGRLQGRGTVIYRIVP